MARPEKTIDWKQVDNLLMANCHGTEIAAHFNMHPNTFYNKVQEELNIGFSEYSAIKKAQGDGLIKAKQFEVGVVDKNVTMLIWLGKQRNGQRENPEVSATFTATPEQIIKAANESTSV
jgi:hypothetical protein